MTTGLVTEEVAGGYPLRALRGLMATRAGSQQSQRTVCCEPPRAGRRDVMGPERGGKSVLRALRGLMTTGGGLENAGDEEGVASPLRADDDHRSSGSSQLPLHRCDASEGLWRPSPPGLTVPR